MEPPHRDICRLSWLPQLVASVGSFRYGILIASATWDLVASVGCLRYVGPLSPQLIAPLGDLRRLSSSPPLWDLCCFSWLPPLWDLNRLHHVGPLLPQFVASAMSDLCRLSWSPLLCGNLVASVLRRIYAAPQLPTHARCPTPSF